MSPREKFDRYMVALGAARHVKFRRLTIPERHAFFLGALSIAAQAPIRGCLLVGDLQAEPADVAAEADVPEKVAAAMLDKLRQVGVIYTDEELGCERVHDFGEWNPEPKSDVTNADRQRRYRQRRNAERNGAVTASRNGEVTLTEVEGEKKTPPTPPKGGDVVKFDRKPVPPDRLAQAERLLADFNRQAGTGYSTRTGDGKAADPLTRIIGGLTRRPDVDEAWCGRAVAWQLANPFWTGPAHPGVVYGPGVFDKALEATKPGQRASESIDDFTARYGAAQQGPVTR
jgi:hypothetical protein